MAEHWIAARTACDIARSAFVLCERLHAGLLVARAKFLQLGEHCSQNAIVPKEFWWAKGHAALEADWDTGDFTTWINDSIECRALGVEVGLSGLSELLPFEERAVLARSLSVAGNEKWITAREARRLATVEFGINPANSGAAIMEVGRLGFIAARATFAQGSTPGQSSLDWDWEEREWDIPNWFWNEFTLTGTSLQDWEIGRFSGTGLSSRGREAITLSGVYFFRESLTALGPSTADPQSTTAHSPHRKGRKPTYDWEAATTETWGEIFRGEFVPKTQAEIEKKLQARLSVGDNGPSESTVRPYANRIWQEFDKA